MISWDRNTRDRILPLLSSPCKPSDTNLHFGSGYMRFLDLNLYCSGCSGESQYTRYSEHDLMCYSFTKTHLREGVFSSLAIFAKNEPYFYNRNICLVYWSGMPYIPPCHRDASMACLPAWVACVCRWQWVGLLPTSVMVPGSSTLSRAASR